MIGFTPEGHVRVWLNENYARNVPDLQSVTASKLGGVQPQKGIVLIDQVYDLVERRLVGGSFPQTFKQVYSQNPPKSFDEALTIIQNYAATHNLAIPSAVSPLRIQTTESTSVIKVQNEPSSTVATQNQHIVQLRGAQQQATRSLIRGLGGAQSQLVIQPNYPRALSVGGTNNQSQLVLSKPASSAILPANIQSRLPAQPAINFSASQAQLPLNVNTSINDLRRQEWNPSRTFDLSNRFGVRQQSSPSEPLGRQSIAFRLNNIRQEAPAGIPNKIVDQVQFARRGSKKSSTSFQTGLVSHIIGVNARYANAEIKQETTTTQKATTEVAAVSAITKNNTVLVEQTKIVETSTAQAPVKT